MLLAPKTLFLLSRVMRVSINKLSSIYVTTSIDRILQRITIKNNKTVFNLEG